jgi:tetratricopeptide (TPR) repeat protein
VRASEVFDALIKYLRGRLYLQLRDYDNAVKDFSEQIRLDFKKAVAYALRGRARQKKGDVDLAIADLSEALRLDPEHEQFEWAEKELRLAKRMKKN